MFKSQITLLITFFVAMAMAAPIDTADRHTSASLIKRASKYSGRGTWFSDTTGSCGISFDQSDMIVALNEAQMGALDGSGSKCGQTLRVSYGGKTVNLKVVDTCPSQYCSSGDIDVSQAAFKELAGGSLSKGVLSLKWEFA
ncbi:hypothetical protein BGZ76_007085 [Entomortierella beljakovae]|nr:hypothetical protein BGZ76_007085 [Entomortierella beljakovae]